MPLNETELPPLDQDPALPSAENLRWLIECDRYREGTEPPDWRSKTGQRILRGTNLPSNDGWVQRYVLFAARLAEVRNADMANQLLQEEPALYQAYQWFHSTEPGARWLVEAYACCGLSVEEIAACTRRDVAEVEAYLALFFDISRYVDNKSALIAKVIAPFLFTDDAPERCLWKLLAIRGGKPLLEAALDVKQLGTNSELLNELTRIFRNGMLMRAAALALGPRTLTRTEQAIIRMSLQLSQVGEVGAPAGDPLANCFRGGNDETAGKEGMTAAPEAPLWPPEAAKEENLEDPRPEKEPAMESCAEPDRPDMTTGPSCAQRKLVRQNHERLRRAMHSLGEFCRFGDILFRGERLNGGRRPPPHRDFAAEPNRDVLIDLQQLELLIVPCRLGQEWAFEELGNRLAAHGATWTQSLLTMVAEVEKTLLGEFPADAQEPMRSHSLQLVDELAPESALEQLVGARIRLCWVAEQLLEWKMAEGAKVHLPARRCNEIGRMLRRTRKWDRIAKKMLNALCKLARKKACGRAVT